MPAQPVSLQRDLSAHPTSWVEPHKDFDGLNNMFQIPFALPWFLLPTPALIGNDHVLDAWITAGWGLLNSGIIYSWVGSRRTTRSRRFGTSERLRRGKIDIVGLESRPEWDADAAAASHELPPGSRIEYVGPDDRELTDARPGDLGTVYAVEHIGDLVVNWDDWGAEVWERGSWKYLRRVDGDH